MVLSCNHLIVLICDKTKDSLTLSAVTKMTEPVKKKHRTICSMLKKVPNRNEQPSSANAAPLLKNTLGSSKAKSCGKDVLNVY